MATKREINFDNKSSAPLISVRLKPLGSNQIKHRATLLEKVLSKVGERTILISSRGWG
uniref:Uncharacterized protein n=1 Tax=Anguilla anguilla TaxID=7936 RepID=A0A0E9SGS1_ANGAN